MMRVKPGDLVLIFDPVRPSGGSGVRGVHIVSEVREDEVIARPLDRLDLNNRLPLTAIRAVWPASYAAEDLFR